jgi:hypothetical protein
VPRKRRVNDRVHDFRELRKAVCKTRACQKQRQQGDQIGILP